MVEDESERSWLNSFRDCTHGRPLAALWEPVSTEAGSLDRIHFECSLA